jgi:hypothetical protein
VYHRPAAAPGGTVGIEAMGITGLLPVTTGRLSAAAVARFGVAPFPLMFPAKRTGSSGDNSKGLLIDFEES